MLYGRAPQGARGLKSECPDTVPHGRRQSRPARGAWVEIQTMDFDKKIRDRRAPQGARGLKFFLACCKWEQFYVAPRKGRVG